MVLCGFRRRRLVIVTRVLVIVWGLVVSPAAVVVAVRTLVVIVKFIVLTEETQREACVGWSPLSSLSCVFYGVCDIMNFVFIQ